MREKLLKALAVFAFGMVSFPVVLTGDAHSFENIVALRLCAYYAVFAAVFALGYALGQAAKRRKKLRLPCRILGAGTFFLSFFLAQYTDRVTVIVTAGAAAVFWYFLGERASRKHYADFFPIFGFGIYIFVTIFAYFAFSLSASEELRPPVQSAVIVSFMAELCLAALLINQSGIYDKANRRRETKALLPRGLSSYNAALVLLFTGAGLSLYLFADKIAWLLRETVRLIVLFILYLMQMSAETMETVPGEEGDLSSMLPKTNAFELWNVLAPLLAIVLVIVFRKRIWAWLKSVFRGIWGLLTRGAGESGETPDFVDFLEEAPAPKRKKKQRLTDAQLTRKYRAEADPLQKYRLGYLLLLRRLNLANARIVPSDTTAAQKEKGRQVYSDGLDAVVAGYNTVRYYEEAAESAEAAALDRLLSGNGKD